MLTTAILLAAAMPAPAQTQADLDNRADTDYVAADAAMTVQYRAAMARMRDRDGPMPVPGGVSTHRTGPSFANALLQAQRAWLPFRDAECLAEAFAFRGSGPGAVDSQCKTRLTNERARQLRVLAQ